MDNAIIKRGIGAIVLAIIAALLLGYLLKDKSRERQEVVEMKLPGAPEMNIPSLIGSDDSNAVTATPSIVTNDEVAEKVDTAKNAGTSMMNAATNTFSSLKKSLKNTTDNVVNRVDNTYQQTTTAIDNAKPGFAIRPSNNNEQRETVDTVSKNTVQPTKHAKAPTTETVIASTKKVVKKAFKPHIVKEKKKVVKKKAVKKAAPKVAPMTASTAFGKYSIQLLATSSKTRAEKLANTMRGEGYTAFITQTTNNDKVLFRVRLGAHADRTEAIQAQESLKRRYQKNFFVQNSLVISNK